VIEDPSRELPADHRGPLYRLLGLSLEAVDAGEHDLLDGRGNTDVLEWPLQPVAAADPGHDARLDERLRHLLDVEGISVRPRGDQPLDLRRQHVVLQHAPGQGDALLLAQSIQRQAHRTGDPAQRMDVCGPVAQNQEDGRGRDDRDQGLQCLQRHPVGPVKVLDHDHERSVAALFDQEGPQGVEGLDATLLRIHGGHRLVAGVHGEQVLQIRSPASSSLLPLRDHLVHPADDLCVVVTVPDAEGGLQKTPHREERNVPPIGEGVPLQPSHRLAEQPASQLEDQARLADAGLAGDGHDLSGALACQADIVLQHGQVAGATDQGGQAVLGGRLEAGAARLLASHPVGPHRCGLSLQREVTHGVAFEEVRDHPVRLLGEQNSSRVGDLLDAGGEIDGVTDRREVHPEVVGDRAHHHRTGVEPEAKTAVDAMPPLHLLGVLVEGALHVQRGGDGAACGVLVCDGSAEEGHHAVSREGGDMALVAVHRLAHARDRLPHERVHVLLAEPLGQRSRLHRVDEEDGHGAMLAVRRPLSPYPLRKVSGGLDAGAGCGRRRCGAQHLSARVAEPGLRSVVMPAGDTVHAEKDWHQTVRRSRSVSLSPSRPSVNPHGSTGPDDGHHTARPVTPWVRCARAGRPSPTDVARLRPARSSPRSRRCAPGWTAGGSPRRSHGAP
jgi:hypothetical protein